MVVLVAGGLAPNAVPTVLPGIGCQPIQPVLLVPVGVLFLLSGPSQALAVVSHAGAVSELNGDVMEAAGFRDPGLVAIVGRETNLAPVDDQRKGDDPDDETDCLQEDHEPASREDEVHRFLRGWVTKGTELGTK